MTTKKYEINCQNNCPITNIYNEKKYVPTINNIPIVKLY